MSETPPSSAAVLEANLATWPAEHSEIVGSFTLRSGPGKRAQAATALTAVGSTQIKSADAAMRARGQKPLFLVGDDEAALDHELATLGYKVFERVNLWTVSCTALRGDGHLGSGEVYAMWPPLEVIREIWDAGKIDHARQMVMDRAPAPKAAVLARAGQARGGVCFVAIHEGIAMIHALHVEPTKRRRGVARLLLKAAAAWALENGAAHIGLGTTQGNDAANALYAKLGMVLIGHYQYRESGEGN